MEYALGSPTDFSGSAPGTAVSSMLVNGMTAKYLTLSFKRRVAATDVVFHVESSADLRNWWETAVQTTSTTNADGTTNELWRFPNPIQSGSSGFLRVRIASP